MVFGTRIKKLRERIIEQGLRKTLFYVFFTVFLERLGIEFLAVFRYVGRRGMPEILEGIEFAIIGSMEDLTSDDRDAISNYGGNTLLRTFAKAFDRGESCGIARENGKFVCNCGWIKNIEEYRAVADYPVIIIGGGFTIPSGRGKGFLPQTLRYTCEHILGKSLREEEIFCECSTFNDAALKGIRKGGFDRIGIKIKAGRWKRFYPNIFLD